MLRTMSYSKPVPRIVFCLLLTICGTLSVVKAKTTYLYDDLGRLEEVIYSTSAGINRTVYGYDTDGNRQLQQTLIGTATLSADLAVEIQAQPPSVIVGNTLTLLTDITNGGADTATGATVQLTIVANANYQFLATSSSNCTGIETVICDLEPVQTGKTKTVSIDLRPLTAPADGDPPLTISVSAQVQGANESDPTSGNNANSTVGYVTNSGDPDDIDGDGLPNTWELTFGLDPVNATDADGDQDNDGLTNLAEFYLRTNPGRPDTDGDGLLDAEDPSPNFNPARVFPSLMDVM